MKSTVFAWVTYFLSVIFFALAAWKHYDYDVEPPLVVLGTGLMAAAYFMTLSKLSTIDDE